MISATVAMPSEWSNTCLHIPASPPILAAIHLRASWQGRAQRGEGYCQPSAYSSNGAPLYLLIREHIDDIRCRSNERTASLLNIVIVPRQVANILDYPYKAVKLGVYVSGPTVVPGT